VSPTLHRRIHLVLALLAIGLMPVVIFTDLKKSLVYLIFLSQVTWISSELSAWQGARVEVRQEEQ
jgi:hypothetical protein